MVKGKWFERGSLLVLLGTVLWSTNAPFFKILQVDSYVAIFIRATIAGIILLPALRLRQIKWDRCLVAMLVSYAALCIGIVLAIRNTSANIATGMQYTAPLLLFLVSWLKGEVTPSFHKHWPLLVLLTGLLVSMCSKGSTVTMRGNLLALSTAVSFTIMTVSSKKATANNPLGMVSLTNLFCALIVLLFFLPPNAGEHLAAITQTEWVILIFLGVFQIAGGYALYYIGLKTTAPSQAAMLAPFEMVLGSLWVAIFVGEFPDWVGAAGSLLIVIGVIGEVVITRKKDTKSPSKPHSRVNQTI